MVFFLWNLVGVGVGVGLVILVDLEMVLRWVDFFVFMLLIEVVLIVVVDKKGGINDVGWDFDKNLWKKEYYEGFIKLIVVVLVEIIFE